MKGFDVAPVIELVESVNLPIIYAGGVTNINDIEKLSKSGVKGVVIGSALYKNKINLKKALKYQNIS